MKRSRIARFIGNQLSRLKAGQTYYMIIISTVTALGIVNIAFPAIDTWIILMLFPLVLLGAFIIGYLMDVWNVATMDHRKTIEMSSRYLNTADFKNNEFRILMMETMFEWFKALQEDKPVDLDVLKEKYKEFVKKWNPPKEK